MVRDGCREAQVSETPEQTLRHWQGALGLLDWTIGLKLKSPDDLNGSLGNCDANSNRRIATINVRTLESTPDHEDIEATIVHELLHLYFDFGSDGDESYQSVRLEQGVDRLADVLVALRHS